MVRRVNPVGQGRRPSLRDVAARAGTSTAVVSYVINHGPRPVAAATRVRVERAIAELGYRPDRLARALRARRTDAIALLLPDLANAFFAEVARAVEDAAFDAGQQLVVAGTRFSVERERAQLQVVLDARVDGIIVIPAHDPGPSLAQLRHAGTPHVVVHRHLPGRAASVSGDDVDAGRQAAEHLLGHGHHAIGCLGGSGAGTPVADRTRGFRDALAAARRPIPDELVVSCDYGDLDTSAYTQARRLLQHRPDLTALCAATDEQALAAIRAAQDAGRQVGSDLALVGIDGTRRSAQANPPLTVVATPFDDLGRHAVTLLRQLVTGERELSSVRLPMRLLTRTSCGCRPA